MQKKKIHLWIDDPNIGGNTFFKRKNDQRNSIAAFDKCLELLSFYLFKNIM